MTEVEPGDVHASVHQFRKTFFRPTGRTDRTNDLGAPRKSVDGHLYDVETDSVVHDE